MNKTLSDTQYMWASVFLSLFHSFSSFILTKETWKFVQRLKLLGASVALTAHTKTQKKRERELKINHKHTQHLSYIYIDKNTPCNTNTLLASMFWALAANGENAICSASYTIYTYLIQRFHPAKSKRKWKWKKGK